MNRRGFLVGLSSIVAAPAIIRVIDLMPVKVIKPKYSYVEPGIYVREFDLFAKTTVNYTDVLNVLDNEIWFMDMPYETSEGSKDSTSMLDRKLRCRLAATERTA